MHVYDGANAPHPIMTGLLMPSAPAHRHPSTLLGVGLVAAAALTAVGAAVDARVSTPQLASPQEAPALPTTGAATASCVAVETATSTLGRRR